MEHIGLYLKDIYHNKKVGQLYFQQGNMRKHIYVINGNLVYARTNQPQELIGEVLFRLGKISSEVYSRIDEFILPKKSIGEVLLANGHLTQSSLIEGLMYQFREIVLNLFSTFDANYKFREGSPFDTGMDDISISIATLIEEGIRRMKYDSNLQSFLEKRIPLPHDKTFIFQLTEEEKEIYEAIDGKRSMEGILEYSGFPGENFWKSMYLFYCLDLIELDGDDPTQSQAADAQKDEPSADDSKVQEVLAMKGRLSEMDYYTVLDVERDTIPAVIKKSYFQLARKYHPDLFDRSLDSEIKETIDEVFDYITQAYRTLTDETAKKKYDRELEQPRKPDSSAMNSDKRAEVKFRQGKTLYDQTRFDEALVFLHEAVRLDSHKSRYYLLLAMTQARLKPYQRKAVDNYKKAIDLERWSPDAYLGLGILYIREKMPTMAAKYLKLALQVDPDNKAVLKELAALEGKNKKKGLKGFFSGDVKDIKNRIKKDFFKKK